MRKPEEFLNNWHKGIISIHNISHDPFNDEPIKVIEIEYNQFIKFMEQFRKEGMKEAYVSGFLEKCGRFYISNKPDEEIAEDFFQEWYNNQIKE